MAASSLPEVSFQMAEYFPHKAQPDLLILRIIEEAFGSRFLLSQPSAPMQTWGLQKLACPWWGVRLHPEVSRWGMVLGSSTQRLWDWLFKAVRHLPLNLGSPFCFCFSRLEQWFPWVSGLCVGLSLQNLKCLLKDELQSPGLHLFYCSQAMLEPERWVCMSGCWSWDLTLRVGEGSSVG